MQITLNIVLDALSPYRLEIHVPQDNKLAFSKCLPLPDDPDQLDDACLYVGGLSKAMALKKADAAMCCICLRDRIKDELETEESLSGLVVVNENISLNALFTVVQNRFFTILNWVQEMHYTLIHGGTMQDIIDLSIPSIIDNYIAVSDSSLMLLAYSKNVPCDDPICVALVKHGYFPEEIIQIFRKYDLFKVWETVEEAYLDDSCEIAKYPVYHKIFRFGNTYFAHVAMTCNRNPLTRSMVDLFNILMDVLAVFMERAWEEKNACNHIYDTFLADLVEGNITSKAVIEERAQYVGIPVTGKFCLFQVVSAETANMSIGKMLIEFADTFPKFKFIRHQQRIVAINHFYAKDIDEQLRDICKSMEPFLKKYDASCGVSLFFSSLEQVQIAYKQSSLALKYAGRMRGGEFVRNIRPCPPTDSRIHFFSEKFFFCLLGENAENASLWYHSEYHGLLKKLCQYDQRHRSNNLQLLHVFLSCERNATAAANSLSMHRNNVTYHISRIQEMLGIDLDDPTVRFMLLVSYYLLELFGFDDG